MKNICQYEKVLISDEFLILITLDILIISCYKTL